MAAESRCIVSLPGDSASSDRVVTTPYTTASSAQTTANQRAVVGQETGQGKPLWTQDKAKRQPDRAAAERRWSLPCAL